MAQLGNQDWTKTRLSQYSSRLWRCLKSAISRYNRLTSDDRLVFGGRCQADVLNAFVLAEAKTEFENVEGSEFVSRNNTTYHSLNGCVLWYKQLNEERMPSNIPTLAIDQMMQGQFEFMPDKLLIVVGFKLDAIKSQIESIELMRFGPGRRLEFIIEIVEVIVQPRVVQMESNAPVGNKRRTKIALRNGFEQTAISSGDE